MFKGKNLLLRPERKEDVATITRIRNEEEVMENLMTYFPYPWTEETELHRFEEKVKHKGTKNPAFVIEKNDGTLIGKCGTMHTNWKDSSTVVFIFIGGAENRGKGYGSEALSLLVDFIFNEMNLNRVGLYVFDFNKRAVKSYEKIGFKVEGVLRQEVFRKGVYNDVYQMSILKDEYFELKRGDKHVF